MKKSFGLPNKVFSLFILVGISLSFINFIHNKSLSSDEAAVGMNIVNRSFGELLSPLDHEQVAPIGFLYVEKLIASAGGDKDWSLKIFPMTSFLLAIFLIYLLALQLKNDKPFALFTAAFFSLSAQPLYYSSEVKQYMSDVFICVCLTLITLVFLKKEKSHSPLIIAGVLSVWFSNIAVVILFCVGLLLLHRAFKKEEKKESLKTILVLSTWVLSFGIYYVFFIHNHPTQAFMVAFWDNIDTFLPYNIFSASFYQLLAKKIYISFRLIGAGMYSTITLPFICIGVYFLYKKDWRLPFLLFFPFLTHLALSYFKLYPFGLRLILYLQPLLLLAVAYGAHQVASMLKHQQLRLLSLSSILIACLLLIFHKGFPFERQEIKQSLEYLNQKIKDTDQLYLYNKATRAFTFYYENYPAVSGLSQDNLFIGDAYANDWKEYPKDVARINQPAWLLFSHVYIRESPEGIVNDEENILQVFEEAGFQIIDQRVFKGSAVYQVIPPGFTSKVKPFSPSITPPPESAPH